MPPPRKALAVRLHQPTLDWLDAEAKRRGLTRAGVAALCIERVWRTMVPPAPPRARDRGPSTSPVDPD